MSEPTGQQKKWLWEQCGFEWNDRIELWHDPIHGLVSSILPLPDLNNLFKYAVPKVIEELKEQGSVVPVISLFSEWYDNICTGLDYVSALFKTCFTILGGKE